MKKSDLLYIFARYYDVMLSDYDCFRVAKLMVGVILSAITTGMNYIHWFMY